jgi:hypothetical protein
MFLKKTTKLLSVLIAVVMLMSCFTMAAFAAKTSYQTSDDLTHLGAYSPDGQASRFTTEERMSIFMDWLDRVLAPVDFELHVNEKIKVAGISLGTIKLDVTANSVNAICASLDSAKDMLDSGIVSAATTFSLLGDFNNLTLNSWTKGSRRENKDQLNLIGQVLNVLYDNVDILEKELAQGYLNLGDTVGGKIDLSKINKILADLPKFLFSKLYPMMQRKDDTLTIADNFYKGIGFATSDQNKPATVLNTFANNLFQKAQSTTTYKEDADGKCISGHTLPTKLTAAQVTSAASNKSSNRYYYVKTAANGTVPAYFTCYVYDPETESYKAEDEKFYRTEESTGVYTYKTNAGDGLKYYKDGTYWLPSFVGKSFNITSDNIAKIFYQFIPYVFGDLAPVALNGWAKEALAKWMGATETKVFEGSLTEGKASAYYASLPQAAKDMFGADVPYYQFSYSKYEAMNNADIQYYRYVDKDTNTEEWFELDMTTGNDYLGLFDFTYVVEGTFMNEFVPASGTATKTLLQSLNDFLCKAARKVLKSDVYNSLGLQTGDNAYIVPNLRKVVQKLLPEGSTYGGQPDAILGPDYLVHYDGYYQTLISTTASNDEVFASLAAIIAKALMPQLILPSAEKLAGQKVGAVLACVVRELVTQFVPTYNYDALIFTDYNTRTLVSGKDNSYWLDVILTMGVDVGMSYLANLADVGRDTTNGLKIADSKTYTLSTFEANPQAWESSVDWIIDWALTSSVEWGWNLDILLDTSSFTVNLATAQDPWVKLDTILNNLLPLKQIINCTAASGKTWLETALRDKLVLGIADLNFDYIFGKGSNYTTSGNAGLLSIPSDSILRTKAASTALWEVVRDLLNKVIYKVGGNANILDTSVFTTVDTLCGKSTFKPANTSYSNCPNFVRPVSFLLRKLPSAYTNVFKVVLPILEMFVGWKTASQEYADPTIEWSANYLLKTQNYADGITMTIKNNSAGMLLKNYKADGTAVYEKAYDIVIDGMTLPSGITSTFTSGAANNTIAPWSEKSYTIKASSVPSADVAQQIVISYHVVGKSGAAIGGTRYLSTYIVVSKNESDIGTVSKKQYDKTFEDGSKTKDGIDFDYDGTVNALCLSADDLEMVLKNDVWYSLTNWSGDYTCAISGSSFTIGNSVMFEADETIANGTIAKKGSDGDSVTYHPIKIKTGKTAADFVSGTAYNIGKAKFTMTSSGNSGCKMTEDGTNTDMGKLYFAEAGELRTVFNEELAKNRVASQYSDSTKFNAYVTAMKNAALILTAPAMVSTFTTNFAATNITNKLNAIKTAVEALEPTALDNTDAVGILENGLKATEVAGAIGADGQINFQDYKLYGYWLYEKNRTEARNIMKEYEGPVEPKAYIEGCWLPYDGSDKNEDLTSVVAAEANATKKAAITASMKQPAQKDVDAYNIAMADWKSPQYTELYVADIAQKLSFYKQFLIDRTYSKVAAGRVQLAQEIAYANAQNYNEADYTPDSWANYVAALAAANTANADGKMQSFVFQAKYDLLVAQRQLRLKAYDWATQNGFDELDSLMALAEGMFANATYFTAVDGTLDTEWTDLIEALGYTANFGTGENAWSMNLYAKSAEQLVSEYIDTRSGRNAQRVQETTAALQAAIDALKCTIEVIKNDTSTVVDQDVKFITNLVPGEITSSDAVLLHVKASNNAATLTVNGVNNNTYFGTGTLVSATLNSIPIANYYVVIYGDINGDNYIDGFDAVKADRKLAAGLSFSAPLEAAADATKDSNFDVNDVGAIINAAAGISDIPQA